MSAGDIQWFAGERGVQTRVADSVADSFQTNPTLHSSPSRSIHRVFLKKTTEGSNANGNRADRALDPSVVVKVHRIVTGRHPLRDRAKRWLGFSPARREWNALEGLLAAGAPVPTPRAWGRLTNGDEIVVMDFVDGDPLAAVGTDAAARADLIPALVSAITKIHDAGYRHGDLHCGNLMLAEKQIVVLDLQRARRQRSATDRLWDLARLELSLAKRGWTPGDRRALRDGLGVDHAFDSILRGFLRDHVRGRARRVLRVGRNWSNARVGSLRGLRDVSLEAEALAEIVTATEHARPTQERRGGRTQIVEFELDTTPGADQVVLVKRIAAGSLRRAIGDRLRRSAAARAFYAGQASGLISNRAARPLAFLEERRFGFPIQSLLVIEKVGEDDLDRIRTTSPESEHRLACALGEWLAEGHAWGLWHRDLKASNIRVQVGQDRIEFWMVDLEDLGGPRKINDEARLEALTQLNASLEDEAMSVAARIAALETYENRVPFVTRKESPARTIARRSLAKAHRWRGDEGTCLDS